MGSQYQEISDADKTFIESQPLFFVGTADQEGRVNISPKGMDSLRVLSPHRVVWLNVTGSGNETAAHIAAHDRMTLMFCAFEGKPLILRLYGHATVVHPHDSQWEVLSACLPQIPGARQIFDLRVDLVQRSCGMAVPYMSFEGQRDDLWNWAEKKGKDGLQGYWERKNGESLDGKPTHIFPSTNTDST